MDKFEIKTASFSSDHDAICHIREQVFIHEQQVPEELEWDGLDDQAFHLLALTTEQQPVGTVRMLNNGHIGRMAVLPDYRHQGAGHALLNHVLKVANQQHLDRVFLHAQTSAVSFYEQQGFISEGPIFMDAGIPHQTMHKSLSAKKPEKSSQM
ncbi:MAG: GNAT family N-acetyltransferase [Gammaproteobacteria bacterium]|nr:GNAT family N-acetyltransferase [Gammaproteobacteria bacterium]